MKKLIYALTLFLCTSVTITSKAQSNCAAITVEAYGPTPQNGSYNQWGVKVTLDQIYDQDITVEGTIEGDDGMSTSAIFNVTVPAGYLSAQSSYLIQTGPATGATVDVTSITPCPAAELVIVSNINNPQETVGQVHNSAMSALMSNYNDGNLQPTGENAFSFTKTYLHSQGYDTAAISSAYNYVLANYGTVYQQTDIAAVANSMYDKGSISATAKNYLLLLADYISSFTVDPISTPTQSAYNSFANNLIALENQFSENSMLTTTDKFVLFSSFAVARYSVVFAVNYPIIPPRNWFRWGDVVGGDIVGAGAGAVGGLITGAGAGVGAIGTSVTCSLYEGGMQIWRLINR